MTDENAFIEAEKKMVRCELQIEALKMQYPNVPEEYTSELTRLIGLKSKIDTTLRLATLHMVRYKDAVKECEDLKKIEDAMSGVILSFNSLVGVQK